MNVEVAHIIIHVIRKNDKNIKENYDKNIS